MIMSPKQRLLFSISGSTFFMLCGLVIFIISFNFRVESLIRILGFLMLLGGLIATFFLYFTLPKR